MCNTIDLTLPLPTRPNAPLLLCPQCGRSRLLHNSAELPDGLRRMLATCPDCDGHAHTGCVLEFDDGRIEFDTGPLVPRHGYTKPHDHLFNPARQ